MLKKFLTILGVKTFANYVRNWIAHPLIDFFKSGKYNRTIYQESFDMAVKETYETLNNEIPPPLSLGYGNVTFPFLIVKKPR